MGFNCGIVGLPNVGKSTLFNALTARAAAEAENYPFCTIEPNVGRVALPDPRLDEIARIARSARVVPNYLDFVDIAGLVRGASRGEGLGNQFLANIREVDAICQVLRCFETDDVAHVEGDVNPVRDADTIETELMLADLESLERRKSGLAKRARGGSREAKEELALVERLIPALEEGTPARQVPLGDTEGPVLQRLQLLTAKPVLYVCNVGEDAAGTGNAHSREVEAMAARRGAGTITVSANIEAEIAQLEDPDEKAEFLAGLGLDEPGLNRMIRAGFALLDLITFFTAGPNEARAWTVRRGAKAPEAAGQIHSDMQRGFIRAETIDYPTYRELGEQGAREAGRLRVEGKDYTVQDGDVLYIRFNV